MLKLSLENFLALPRYFKQQKFYKKIFHFNGKNSTLTANANFFRYLTSKQKKTKLSFHDEYTRRKLRIGSKTIAGSIIEESTRPGQIFARIELARVEIFGRMSVHSLSRWTESEKIPPERAERDRERSDSKSLEARRGCRGSRGYSHLEKGFPFRFQAERTIRSRGKPENQTAVST